ncbi:MAG: type II toxin-antitoxin system HipA family toxin [Candidatus Dormibacteraeota bacterium]|nr:type II toxin-antitoxin system HipA family toxin [Candidatus Dormibacteraeota bacterium]
MPNSRSEVVVYLDSEELGPRRPVGTLRRERSGSKSVISFAYDPGWLTARDSFALDPSLPLYEGEQFKASLPGIFTDAAPDRWGRTLLERREALVARREKRKQRGLDDWDFLVGVNDQTRMGALRLARVSDGAFVDNEPLSVPRSTELRELEHWAAELEKGLPQTASEGERWIAMLIAPGSSLGGARPKANFLGKERALWIAKFPSRDDRHDVGGWEYVVTGLARDAAIGVPETKLLRLGSTYRTFCARRFDRLNDARRLYASAMTLVGKQDNESASYLDVARAIVNFADPAAIVDDLQQLYRRVVFNVLTANRDDHLRNHGFLRTRKGWRLAPAFDINPSPEKLEHSLAINDTLRTPDLDIVRETAPFYRLSTSKGDALIHEVQRAASQWSLAAREARIPRDEVERLATAFERGNYN